MHRVAPRYLKLVTSSNFWPFMLISALMLFVLEVTRDLQGLNLLVRLIVLHRQIIFSLTILLLLRQS